MLLVHLLRRLVTTGNLAFIDPKGRRHVISDGPGPKVTLRARSAAVPWRVLRNPSLAIGEAYMDGDLTMEEGSLYDFLDLAVRHLRRERIERGDHPVARLQRFIETRRSRNPVAKARGKVSHHYDLKPALFDLFLDGDRQYSCAYFATDNDDIETAQRRKKTHLAAKLRLRSGDRVLDIGSGWGGLGLHIARVAPVDVTGVTLSHEQHAASNARAEAEGLADRVRFRLQDYRNDEGRYERIVSVGMLEHVGLAHYREFFRKVRDMLTDDGVAVIHTIGRYDMPGPVNPWIERYIFPGTYVPTLSELTPAIEEQNLLITDIEVLRTHYARTLKAWRERFVARWEEAKAMYDERFCRMWEFYLTACEVGFRNKELNVFQIQMTKELDAVPETRDYIGEFEAAH